jgi:hypothetical protein
VFFVFFVVKTLCDLRYRNITEQTAAATTVIEIPHTSS